MATAAVDTAIESTMRMSYDSFLPMMRQWERDIVKYRCALSATTYKSIVASVIPFSLRWITIDDATTANQQ